MDTALPAPNILAALQAPDAGSELQRAREERDQLQDQLHQARKLAALGLLAGGVVHDFNNLLTVIVSGLERATLGALPGDEARLELVDALDAAKLAADLAHHFLAQARDGDLRVRPISAEAEIRKLSGLLHGLLSSRIELRLALTDGLPSVLANPELLCQILVNLLANARDAMPDGGVVTIAVSSTGPWVEIAVLDTGSGMDPAALARAFEPLFTTKDPTRHSGLGLATVADIVRRLCGTIEVESTPRGTAVRIHLPAAGTPASRD